MRDIKYSTIDHICIYKLCKPIFSQAINLALLGKTQGEITWVILYFKKQHAQNTGILLFSLTQMSEIYISKHHFAPKDNY